MELRLCKEAYTKRLPTMNLILGAMLQQQQVREKEKSMTSSHSTHETVSTAGDYDSDDEDQEIVPGGDYFLDEGSISSDELLNEECKQQEDYEEEMNDSFYCSVPIINFTAKSGIMFIIMEETELDLLMEKEDEDISINDKGGDYDDQLLESIASLFENWRINGDNNNCSFSDSLEGSFLIT